MKNRRHHNNKGFRQVKRGKTALQVKRMAKRLGLKFEVRRQDAKVNHSEYISKTS